MVERVLHQWADDIWLLDGDRVRMFGLPLGTRMVVVRLASGGLWLWSPVAPSEARFDAVAALGPVEHIVAPNKLHHLFIGPWRQRFPGAKCWAAPGLAPRRKDLAFDGELGDAPPLAWASDLDQLLFRGCFLLDEAFFLHRKSGTLIVVDFIQNHDPTEDGVFWRGVKRAIGVVAPDGGVPMEVRMTMTDRVAARACVKRLFAWEFDRLVIAHGICLERDARAHIESAFTWLRRGSASQLLEP
jgi:hypothetical protein